MASCRPQDDAGVRLAGAGSPALVAQTASGLPRCQGITQKGRQCSRSAKHDAYCWQHKPTDSAAAAAAAPGASQHGSRLSGTPGSSSRAASSSGSARGSQMGSDGWHIVELPSAPASDASCDAGGGGSWAVQGSTASGSRAATMTSAAAPAGGLDMAAVEAAALAAAAAAASATTRSPLQPATPKADPQQQQQQQRQERLAAAIATPITLPARSSSSSGGMGASEPAWRRSSPAASPAFRPHTPTSEACSGSNTTSSIGISEGSPSAEVATWRERYLLRLLDLAAAGELGAEQARWLGGCLLLFSNLALERLDLGPTRTESQGGGAGYLLLYAAAAAAGDTGGPPGAQQERGAGPFRLAHTKREPAERMRELQGEHRKTLELLGAVRTLHRYTASTLLTRHLKQYTTSDNWCSCPLPTLERCVEAAALLADSPLLSRP